MATSNNSEFEFKGGSMNGFLMCVIDEPAQPVVNSGVN